MIKFLLLILLQCSLALGASHYIRMGASGTESGNNWNDAWDDLPATLTRGDTFYVADGDYASYEFNDIEDGSDSIWVLKATATRHGIETGWSNAYGDGQAFFTAAAGPIIAFRTGHYYIDGAWGSDTSEYGFEFTNPNNGVLGLSRVVEINQNIVDTIKNMTFRYCAFRGAGSSHTITPPAQGRIMYISSMARDFNINHCAFVGGGTQWIQASTMHPNWIIDHNWFNYCGSGDADYHSAGVTFYSVVGDVSVNLVISNNVFLNCDGGAVTGLIQIGHGSAINMTGVDIHGNYVRQRQSGGGFFVGNSGGGDNRYTRIYNNTITGYWTNCTITMLDRFHCLAFNNFLENVQSLNGIDTANNIINKYGQNLIDTITFQLKSPYRGAWNVDSLDNRDPLNKVRGGDGFADYGAFEYQENVNIRRVRNFAIVR